MPNPNLAAVPPGVGSESRIRLLLAAERLFAARGFEAVTDREIVAAAGHRNNSAIRYHFGSRVGLIEAIWFLHSEPVNRHRAEMISRLPPPEQVTVRQLMEAHVHPLAAELMRYTPSYWARFNERQLLRMPTRFMKEFEADLTARADHPPLEVLARLLRMVQRRLRHLTREEAADRVALTMRWICSGLASWERDVEAGLVANGSLPARALTLLDLSVSLLEAPSNRRPHAARPPSA